MHKKSISWDCIFIIVGSSHRWLPSILLKDFLFAFNFSLSFHPIQVINLKLKSCQGLTPISHWIVSVLLPAGWILKLLLHGGHTAEKITGGRKIKGNTTQPGRYSTLLRIRYLVIPAWSLHWIDHTAPIWYLCNVIYLYSTAPHRTAQYRTDTKDNNFQHDQQQHWRLDLDSGSIKEEHQGGWKNG